MQPGKPLTILLSGLGLIGRKHAELLAHSERSNLAVVVAPRSPVNVAFAERYNVPLFETMEAAFANVLVDAAIIASPNEFHCDQALACIERSIPALVEKPLAVDLNAANLICEKSRSSAVPILVGHHRTYSPLLPAAREFIASPRFGQLVAVQGSALFRKPEHYFDEGPWRTRVGGGPILINLIHEIGVMQYLCGPIKSVSAQASNSRRGFEVEDTVIIGLLFDNGAMGSFVLSDIAASNKSWEMTSGENPAYPHFTDADCYHFAGTNGSLDFPTMRARYYEEGQEPSWWSAFRDETIKIQAVEPLGRQLAHFEDVVSGLATPIVPAEAGRANMLVLEAVKMSILNGRPVAIATLDGYSA
jgi:predicted dehydrogenase